MGWFGSSDDEKPTSTYSESSFGAPSGEFSAPSSFQSGGGGGLGGTGNFEQDVMMEQQQALVKAAMFKLTELSFEKCVKKPSSSLSSSEQSCISSVVTKYLEASQMVTQGMAGGQQ
jgi:mitochondrial import inner membrane translocase subunit TIM13